MASGPSVQGGSDGARERQRFTESKVYTRKAFKGPRNANCNANGSTNTIATTVNNKSNNDGNTVAATTTAQNNRSSSENGSDAAPTTTRGDKDENIVTATAVTDGNDNEKTAARDTAVTNNGNGNLDKDNNSVQPVAPEDGNSIQRELVTRIDAVSNNPTSLNHEEVPVGAAVPSTRDLPSGNGPEKAVTEGQVKIIFSSMTRLEMRMLRQKLEGELDTVRNLVKRIEAKQGQQGQARVYSRSHFTSKERINSVGGTKGTKRVHSEVASVGVPREASRPFPQLSVSVLENSQGLSDIMEKEKRTPKANQFYSNSEFLLAKDKIPPAESNKKSKLNLKKPNGGEWGHAFGMGSKFFKNCSSLLEKLMKHKHGWVFNTPVDVEGLGLHDYFTIITHPMDLGTVKSRLDKNWYKSPKEFAEDVRLTFRNAMTYNPKGQDVHIMAEQLSKIFEDRWMIIESDYYREMRFGVDYGASLSTPTFRRAPPQLLPPLDMRRNLERSESMTHPIHPKPKQMVLTPSGRKSAPKKPKAKDLHKRDMTYEEKQKLSTNLQSLPSEKLDAIVQIIKKRNSALSQHDDEIEVDIDSVDAETLWELDRFVTNYKKSLSKNKRKAELAIQARAAENKDHDKNQASAVEEAPKVTQEGEKTVSPPQLQLEGRQEDNRSRSSSSSSSSSESGSSSSDSDSESSSASGSDAGSPRS